MISLAKLPVEIIKEDYSLTSKLLGQLIIFRPCNAGVQDLVS